MTDNFKRIHNSYCTYETEKAKENRRFYSAKTKAEKQNVHGIKTSNLSKAMLIRELASIF